VRIWCKRITEQATRPTWLSDPYFKLKPLPPTPDDEICSCPGNPPLKLMSTALLGENPIHCLRCNLEVPPERLRLSASDVDAIAHWRTVYGAIDSLELDSGPYEGWARSQLLDPTSPPNLEGFEVSRRLNAIRRCYFWFFQPEADDDYESLSVCPIYKEPLVAYDDGIFPQLLCERDSLVIAGGYRRDDDEEPDDPTERMNEFAVNLAVVADSQASRDARVEAARSLGMSNDTRAWDALFALATDQSAAEVLAREVGQALAEIAYRIRDRGKPVVRGQDENFLLRDFTEAAFAAYDLRTAELKRHGQTE